MAKIPKEEHTLDKIAKEASMNASLALLKLSGEKVSVEFTKERIGKIQNVFSHVDPESMVAGVYLPITGDIKGASILIFPRKIAYTLCDVLVRRKPGTTRQLSELDKSALKEVGNIICGSLLTVFSNTLKIKIIENIPEFSFDMFGAVVDQVIAQFVQKAEDVLLLELKFGFEHIKIKGHVLLVFGAEEMKVIIESMK
jgi:chemotaxis protein CheC